MFLLEVETQTLEHRRRSRWVPLPVVVQSIFFGGLMRACLSMILILFVCASEAIAADSLPRPNIILIVLPDLDARSVEAMSRLKALKSDGIVFSNAFATTSVSTPSRVSILTGQYAHNHGVLANSSPAGGIQKFKAGAGYSSNIATWLRAAGYQTAFMGKYLGEYGLDKMTIPPGWVEWHGLMTESHYYNYLFNENGRFRFHSNKKEEYLTDVLADRALHFLASAVKKPAPFFLYFAPLAPQFPPVPAERHRKNFVGERLPQVPSFNEADLGDKPAWLRKAPQFDSTQRSDLDVFYQLRLQSLLAVDEAIEKIFQMLRKESKLEKTVIIFTADNGFHLGEHRISNGKRTPYEEAIRVPLIIWDSSGGGRGSRTEMTLNIDLAPTIAELAGVPIPTGVDGQSLVSVLRNDKTPSWRRDLLLEHWANDKENKQGTPDYVGLRRKDYLFVKYGSGEVELYDLAKDPHQLDSLHERAEPSLVEELSARLSALKGCAAATCRE